MRVRIFFSSFLLLMLNVALLHAQCIGPGCPCDNTDPDVDCSPLDTWVVGLAIIVVVFAAWHIRNKQKKLAPVVQK